MNYAKILDGYVANILILSKDQSHEFPDCVALNDIPACIGDQYIDGSFYRYGKEVKTDLQYSMDQLRTVASTALAFSQDVCNKLNEPPSNNVGVYISGAEAWEPNKNYERYDLFSYNGSVGWVKQAHTSQETWPPFSVGSEALYGARPVPDENGVYQYVYNMAVDVDMLVYDTEDDKIYRCIQATSDLLYAPHLASSLFEVVD